MPMTDVEEPGNKLGDELDDELEPPRARRRWPVLLVALAVLCVGLGVGLGLSLSNSSSAAPPGPEGVPIQQVPDLASANSTASGRPVDGITCRTSMQQAVGHHIHAHLAIFVNGQQMRIPAGAGIAAPRLDEQLSTGLFIDNGVKGCLYWLHVHADDGIIHIESPVTRTFSLGQFFDIWGQPLGPHQVGPAKGVVVAFENGKQFVGNPRNIPLQSQAVIQLDVGSPVVPFQPLRFSVIGLCGGNSTSCSSKSG